MESKVHGFEVENDKLIIDMDKVDITKSLDSISNDLIPLLKETNCNGKNKIIRNMEERYTLETMPDDMTKADLKISNQLHETQQVVISAVDNAIKKVQVRRIGRYTEKNIKEAYPALSDSDVDNLFHVAETYFKLGSESSDVDRKLVGLIRLIEASKDGVSVK